MACHEIAALRLGMMRVLGRTDEAERQHELAEIGAAADQPGPICTLTQAADLEGLQRAYQASLVELDERAARAKADSPEQGYLRTLLVLARKVELDLSNQIDSLTRLYRDLDTMHDFVHEIYPAE